MSNQQEALSLALETLSEIFKDTSSTASILRRCLTISSLLNDEQEHKWIKEELDGYYRENITFGELQKVVPEYRKVKVRFNDSYGRHIVIPAKVSLVQDEVVTQSIEEIEDSIDNGLTILSSGLLDIVRELGRKDGISVATAHIEGLALKNIVELVRNRALDFVNRVIRDQGQQKVAKELQENQILIIHDQQTEDARLLLYSLENALRQFVSQKLREKGGEVDKSIKRDWESSEKKEFQPPRQPLKCDLINYSSFDQLKRIIVQHDNWEKIFRSYFGRPDGVISRINELDDIRDTIAHNRILSSFDFGSFKTLYAQITGCIEKKEVA